MDILQSQVDQKLDQMIERFYKVAPMASYQKDAEKIDKAYFIRHSIEIVLRIKHKRIIDALVIHYFTKTDLRLAKMWAHYAEDEMLHGEMFAKDIEKLSGLSLDNIYRDFEPMFATKLLNGYFYYTLEHEGPLAAITSAYFLEYTTRKTQPIWLDNLEKVFGKENLKGARAHVNHDINDNHSDFVWKIIISLTTENSQKERFHYHLENIFALFIGYFTELYESTINKENTSKVSTVKNIIASTVASL